MRLSNEARIVDALEAMGLGGAMAKFDDVKSLRLAACYHLELTVTLARCLKDADWEIVQDMLRGGESGDSYQGSM